MRPVPERSHMLKTCPTKAGPPPFPLEFTLPILTADGNPGFDSAEDNPFTVADDDFEGETESGWVDSKREGVDWVSGSGEVGSWKGMQILDCGGGGGKGGVLWGERRETRDLVVELRKVDSWWWWWWFWCCDGGSGGEGMVAGWVRALRGRGGSGGFVGWLRILYFERFSFFLWKIFTLIKN